VVMTHHRGGTVIFTTFVAAIILTIIPLPDWLAAVRPEWVALVLIYWCMALPTRVGVGFGWSVGLVMDVVRASLMGQHALSFGILAFITLHVHQRVRVFPLWQQAFSVLVLILVHEMLMLWIKGITGQPTQSLVYWLPSFSSMLVWPLMFLLLRNLRRRFKVS